MKAGFAPLDCPTVLTLSQLLALVGVWIVGAYTPGPDMLLVIQRSLSSRWAGFASLAGVVTGVAIWLGASMLGLAAILQAREDLLHWLQLAGGGFLVFMGVTGLCSAWPVARETVAARRGLAAATSSSSGSVRGGTKTRTLRGDYVRGLATNLSNPKAVVFFGSLLAPFLYPGGERLSLAASLGIFALLVTIAVFAFASVTLAASHPKLNARIRTWLPVVDAVSAVLFIGIGTFIAAAALVELV